MLGPSPGEMSSHGGLGHSLVVLLTSRGSMACGLAVCNGEESE